MRTTTKRAVLMAVVIVGVCGRLMYAPIHDVAARWQKNAGMRLAKAETEWLASRYGPRELPTHNTGEGRCH